MELKAPKAPSSTTRTSTSPKTPPNVSPPPRPAHASTLSVMDRRDSYIDLGPQSARTSILNEELGMQVPADALPPPPRPIARSLSSPRQRPCLEKHDGPLSAPAGPLEYPTIHSPRFALPTTRTFSTNPRARFRAAVHKIIALRRNSAIAPHGRVGAEPGIDPHRESAFLAFGHIKQRCTIEVVDYSSVRSCCQTMDNSEFIKFLSNPTASERGPWSRVRWINVGGISWDVVSALALTYDIHPLAVEDVLHERKASRSKVDYYRRHLFLRILCHTLAAESDADGDTPASSVTNLPRTASLEPSEDIVDMSEGEEEGMGEEDDRTLYGSQSGSQFKKHRSLLSSVTKRLGGGSDIESRPRTSTFGVRHPRFTNYLDMRVKSRKDARTIRLIRELKKGDRVNVKITPMCMFLFRDGTVITMHPDTSLNLTAPVADRLRQRDSVLRTSADASLLVESLIDLVVDNALEVVEEYHSNILKLERSVLLKPTINHVRRLHIIQGDLILHKRTLEPIKTVVYGLRRYDIDRSTALSESLDPGAKVQGYMSSRAKAYLADVQDHVEYVLSSLEMFAGVSENLVNYTFNMSSYEMNEVMRRLTLVTIIFFPLTLLTGYFGMNFENMWSISHGHSDLVFWIIALPLMAILLPIFLWSDLERLYHYTVKKMRVRATTKRETKRYKLT